MAMAVWPADRSAALSCLVGFFAAASYAGATVPALPIYARGLGASDPETGFIVAASLVVAAAVAQTGPAHTPIARWRTTLAGVLLLAVIPLLYTLAADPRQLLVLRLAHGLGLALLPSLLVANPIDAAAAWHNGRRVAAAALCGWVLGPLAGGQALAAMGSTASFALAGGLGALALAALLAVRADRLQWEEHDRSPLLNRAVAAPVALGLAFAALAAFLPLYALDLGLHESQIGLLFAVYAAWAMASAPIVTRAALASPGALTVIGLLLGALGAASLGTWLRFPILVLAMACLGLGTAAVCVSRRPGQANGTCHNPARADLAPRAAHAVGPVLAGVVVPLLGSAALFFLAAILLALAAVVVAALAPAAVLRDKRYADVRQAGVTEAQVGLPGSEGRLHGA